MTDISIPADVLELAAKVVNDAEAECRKERYIFGFPTVHGKETLDKHIARAIIADRAAQAERMARLEEVTIERCAITAETHWLTICGELSQHRERHEHGLGIAAAIRALSQEGSE